jgi:hypothetical protein
MDNDVNNTFQNLIFDKNLKNQIQNMTDEDMDNTTNNITSDISKIFESENDQMMNNVFGELIKSVINEIKNAPSEGLNIFAIAKSVAEKTKPKFNKDQMQYVSEKMNNISQEDIYININKIKQEDLEFTENEKKISQSVVELIDTIKNKSIEIINDLIFQYANNEISESQFDKNKEQHFKLQEACETTKNKIDNKNDFNRIIKKIYITIKENINFFYPEPNVLLFRLKNDDNSIITIIPGVNIYLIFENNLVTEKEQQIFWGKMYEIYILVLELFEETSDLIQEMKEKLDQFKLSKNNYFLENILDEVIVL